MCGRDRITNTTLGPEYQLAALLSDDLNIYVNPQALRVFLRARWDKVSKLAHEVHDQ